MSCNQTLNGLTKDCLSNKGGISEVYIANADDVTAIGTTTGKVTSITMASSAKFHRYALPKGTGSLSSNYQINLENGTTYVQSDILMVFNRMRTQARIEITALAHNDMAIIVKDGNGLYWYIGAGINAGDEPVVMSAGDGLSGTARGDRNGYSVTLQGETEEMPYEILVGEGGVDIDSLVA